MNTQKSPYAIDNDLYQLYTDIQLREVENDATISLDEKMQLKAILMSIKELDGNMSYSIFQEIFRNSVEYRTAIDQEQLMAYTNTIGQDVLDTDIAESVSFAPNDRQTLESMISQQPSSEDSSRTVQIYAKTTRSQSASTESHTTIADDCSANSGNHIPINKDHFANIENAKASNEDHAANSGCHTISNDGQSKDTACHTPSTAGQKESTGNQTAITFIHSTESGEPKTRRRPKKRTIVSLGALTESDDEKPIEQILLTNPRTEIQHIKAHPQRSSAIFRMRMRAINEPKSAQEKAYLETFDVRDVMQIFRKPMNEFISLLPNKCQTKLNKCRQMLCAYQIGKIVDQILRESSSDNKERLETSLFHSLTATLSKNCFHYSRFRGLCVNSLYLVEHVGAHILFVPEVISPAILKEMDTPCLAALARHLINEWPPHFKKLARLTYYGEVVVARTQNEDLALEKEERFKNYFLNNF
ncbi:hypothetical protein PS15m_006756 [Mucor circinelloides]